MKTRLAIALLLIASFTASAADQLRIKASKQLDSRRNSGSQDVGFGRTSLTQKEYFYRFEVQALSPKLANPLKFEWAVMYEDWEGRIRPGTHGTAETNVTMTKTAIVESETVQLNQRNWQGAGGRAGKIEDKIVGYGVRVTDSNGNQIAEQFEPSSLKKEIDWKTIDEKPNEEALRGLKRMLEGGGRPPPGGPPPDRPRRP